MKAVHNSTTEQLNVEYIYYEHEGFSDNISQLEVAF